MTAVQFLPRRLGTRPSAWVLPSLSRLRQQTLFPPACPSQPRLNCPPARPPASQIRQPATAPRNPKSKRQCGQTERSKWPRSIRSQRVASIHLVFHLLHLTASIDLTSTQRSAWLLLPPSSQGSSDGRVVTDVLCATVRWVVQPATAATMEDIAADDDLLSDMLLE